MTLPADLPVAVSVPDDPLFEEGSTLILECCAEGDPLPVYAWTRLDEEMPSKAVGVTSHSLLISNTTISDIGVYACMAFNEGGVLQSSSIQTFFRPYGKTYKARCFYGASSLISLTLRLSLHPVFDHLQCKQ